ncbi:hypothetical protein VTK26DRAFT_2679 [Humicola hyalothermophila]
MASASAGGVEVLPVIATRVSGSSVDVLKDIRVPSVIQLNQSRNCASTAKQEHGHELSPWQGAFRIPWLPRPVTKNHSLDPAINIHAWALKTRDMSHRQHNTYFKANPERPSRQPEPADCSALHGNQKHRS